MTTQTLPELEFLSKQAISLRAIDQEWIKTRALELGDDPVAALSEAVQTLYDRIGHNVKEDEEVMVFTPENDTDPYVVGIYLDQRTVRQKLAANNATRPAPAMLDSKENSMREDFENLLFEQCPCEPSVIQRDERGRYVVAWVNARWEGFLMYHNNISVIKQNKFQNKYVRTLGRYVIGKMALNGAVLFTKAPFRHQTKALAMEEANRLSTELGEVFAVFRCLDIVDAN